MLNGHLLNIDFAALRTLSEVKARGSFTGAAEALNLNQSTISYTMERLRRAFNDPLFVRQGGGIVATEKCQDLLRSAKDILSEVEALAAPSTFDPATADVEVTVTMNYLVRMTFFDHVVRRLRKEAPKIQLMTRSGFSVEQSLFDGEVDIALAPFGFAPSSVPSEAVLRDHMVAVVDKQHPFAKTAPDRDAYLNAAHIGFHLASNYKTFRERMMDDLGVTPNQPYSTTDASDVGRVLPGTDLVATVPSRVARLLSEQYGLAGVRCPLDLKIEVHMFWAPRSETSPLNAWLRDLIREAAALQPPAWHV
jgi:DNA-binding transcriptional LysR family regulator